MKRIKVEIVLEVPDHREPHEYDWIVTAVDEQMEDGEQVVATNLTDDNSEGTSIVQLGDN